MGRHLPWYKRDVDAWRGGTRGMSLELRGFYSECLDAMWDLQGAIKRDVKILAVRTGCNPRTVRKLLPQLIALGKLIETPDGYINTRMMHEIADANSDRPRRQLPANCGGIDGELEANVAKNTTISTREKEEESESEREEDSPPPPQGRCERGSRYCDLIEGIRSDGKSLHIVEHLIVPMLGSLTVQHPDPIGLLRDIRDQQAVQGLPIAALQRLADKIKIKRKKLISSKDVIDHVAEATSGLPMTRVEKGAANWAAWCEELKRRGLAGVIRHFEQEGYMMQWTEWPDWHPNYQPKLANGRAA